MVKEKKLTKSSIAIIVLALLLVASLIMGMTGAWFTDKYAPSTAPSAQFGVIDISVDDGVSFTKWESTIDKLMPGDKLDPITVTNSSNVHMYVRYKLEVSLTGYDASLETKENKTAEEQALVDCNAALQTLFGQAGWRYVKTGGDGSSTYATYDAAAYSTNVLADAAGDGTNQIINVGQNIYINQLEFDPAVYGNLFQNKTITVTFEVQAIQAANFNNAAAAWAVIDTNGVNPVTGLTA